jgi:hypothetical protein
MTQPACDKHGPMEKQSPGTQEQQWCGEWWRCQHCTNTVLIPSKELEEFNDAQLRRFCEKEGWDFEATKAAGTPMTANLK